MLLSGKVTDHFLKIILLIASLTIIELRSFVGAKEGDADCHMYNVGDYGSCQIPGNQVTQKDLAVDCRYKGNKAPKHPCVTAALNHKQDCGKCFKITMIENGAPKGTGGCNKDGCPGFERSIMVRVIDLTAKADYEVAANGWSGGTGVCPGVCAHTGYCSEKSSVCQYGWLPDSPGMKSGCYSNSKPIRHTEVPCPGGAQTGGGGTKPKPKTPKPKPMTKPPVVRTTRRPKRTPRPNRRTTRRPTRKPKTQKPTPKPIVTAKPSGGGGNSSSGGKFSCSKPGFFAHKTDPHKYYQCGNGKRPWIQSCSSFYWHQKLKNCLPYKP